MGTLELNKSGDTKVRKIISDRILMFQFEILNFALIKSHCICCSQKVSYLVVMRLSARENLIQKVFFFFKLSFLEGFFFFFVGVF